MRRRARRIWGDYSRLPDLGSDLESWQQAHRQRQQEAELAAREANDAKQRGFYVDRADDGTVLSPTALPAGTTAADLRTAAQVIEMQLIRDHTRMKHDAATPYDSTHPPRSPGNGPCHRVVHPTRLPRGAPSCDIPRNHAGNPDPHQPLAARSQQGPGSS
ncbi:AbiV family abortive infection protein [Saccharomonospora sp. NPDC046836]|uniref:AbiV family abortive infection protein n=1 Tax=Saccharomonospora sp. NPDC046836 TaxID=3156921 RepID=UPI0033FC500A